MTAEFTKVFNTYEEKVEYYQNRTDDFIGILRSFAEQQLRRQNVPGGNFVVTGNSTVDAKSDLIGTKPIKPGNTSFNAPTNPGNAPTPDIGAAADITIPTFTDTPPNVTIGVAPTISIPDEPTAPSIKDVTTPVAPDVVLPTLPTLATVEFASAPSLQIPAFTEKFPDRDPMAFLSSKYEYSEVDYQNDVLDQVSAVLLDDLLNGGFGVTHDDEELLYERQKDRVIQESKTRETELVNKYAGRNFQIPPGSMVEILNGNIKDTHAKLSEANRDVSTTRAELLRKGREFAITQGLGLNDLLLRDYGFKQERALKSSQFAAEFGLRFADYEIAKYNSYVQSYQAYASAYETQIRAVLARTEIFKTEVDAAVAKQTANKLEVDIYTAQIGAADTLVKLFETEMRAAQVEVEIEKTRIDAFQSQIQAFVSQVNAQKVTVEAYESSVRGELAKVDIFKTQVNAYESQVRAAAIENEALNKNVTIDIEKGKLDLAGYAAKVEKYTADLAAETSRVQSLASIYGTDSDVYRSIMSAWGQILGAENTLGSNVISAYTADKSFDQKAAEIEITDLMNQAELKQKATVAGVATFAKALDAAQQIFSLAGQVTED